MTSGTDGDHPGGCPAGRRPWDPGAHGAQVTAAGTGAGPLGVPVRRRGEPFVSKQKWPFLEFCWAKWALNGLETQFFSGFLDLAKIQMEDLEIAQNPKQKELEAAYELPAEPLAGSQQGNGHHLSELVSNTRLTPVGW